jgi:hypothetical protein
VKGLPPGMQNLHGNFTVFPMKRIGHDLVFSHFILGIHQCFRCTANIVISSDCGASSMYLNKSIFICSISFDAVGAGFSKMEINLAFE